MHGALEVLVLVLLWSTTSGEAGRGPAGKSVVVVVVWSPGHCGTTALADRRIYEDTTQTVIQPERGTRLKSDYERGGRKGELAYAAETFWPHVSSSLEAVVGPSPVYFEPGHQTVSFIYGLLNASAIPEGFKVVACRLRRARYEHAMSLRSSHPERVWRDLCDMGLRYKRVLCPYDRPSDVVTAVPPRTTWVNFSSFQQALWILDEEEARWRTLQTLFPPRPDTLAYVDDLRPWSARAPTHSPDDFSRTVDAFAKLINTRVLPNKALPQPPKDRHSSDLDRSKIDACAPQLWDQDRRYRAWLADANPEALRLLPPLPAQPRAAPAGADDGLCSTV